MSDKITGKELLQMGYEELRAIYPDLMHLFGCYFHQDWKDSYWWDQEPDYRLVVRTYKREVPEEEVKRAAAQLRELIEVTRDLDEEEELWELTWRLGSWLDPEGLGMTEREWLADVLGILEEPMEETNRYPKLRLKESLVQYEPMLEYASSFASRDLLDWAQREFIKHYQREIAEWLKTDEPIFAAGLELNIKSIGLVVDKEGREYLTNKIWVVLVRDKTSVGYHVYTAYPIKWRDRRRMMSDKISGKELLQMDYEELRARYGDLMHLFGGYLHQDWEESYQWDQKPDYRLVVRTYKREVPEEKVKRAAAQLRELIEVTRDLDEEEELREITIRLGSCLNPRGLRMRRREWLADVLGILEEPMEETNRYPKLQIELYPKPQME